MEEIFEILKKYEKAGDFSHEKVTDSTILHIEKALNVYLPEDYVLYLKVFGDGGLGGFNVWGVDKGYKINVLDNTLYYRKYGLAEEYIAIESCDEWIVCIDSTSSMVYHWYPIDNKVLFRFDDFQSYLRDRLEDYLENK